MTSGLNLLRNREFRGLLVAQVAGELGDNVARVALASLVLARTDSAFLAVLAFVVSWVPAVLGAAVLGGVADRFPRKVVLIGCDLARAVVVGVLALVAVDATPVWLLLGLLLVAETFTAPFESAQRSVLPDVLPDPRDCLAGSGLLRVMHQVDQVVGIVLAGAVIVLSGERAALLLDVVTFLVSAAVVARTMRWRPAAGAGEKGGARRTALHDVRAGWRTVFDDPTLRALVLLGWGAAVVIIAPEAVALAYARFQGADPAVGAALMAAAPAGAAVSAWWIGRREPMSQVRAIIPLAVGACLPLLATSAAPPWPVALVLWLLSGACQGFMVPLLTTVNLVTPGHLRGRVNGLAGGGFALVTGSTLLAAGAVADLTSPAVAVTLAGALGLLLVGAAHRTWPSASLRRTTEELYRLQA